MLKKFEVYFLHTAGIGVHQLSHVITTVKHIIPLDQIDKNGFLWWYSSLGKVCAVAVICGSDDLKMWLLCGNESSPQAIKSAHEPFLHFFSSIQA